MNNQHLMSMMGLAGALLLTGPALANEVELQAELDVTLYEKEDGSIANGVGEYFFVGNTDQSPGDWKRRGIIAFDIAGSIPAGSTINSVTLRLYMSRTKTNDDRIITLHPATQDWGEGPSDAPEQEGAGTGAEPGDATWIHTFYDTSFWSSAGGDYESGASASLPVGGNGFHTWGSTADMVADVQGWLDDPPSNHGWFLIGVETVEKTAKRFNSRQFTGQSTRRPLLTVDFTPAAETGACCLFDGSCIEVASEADCIAAGGTFQGFGISCTPELCPQPTGACCLPGGVCEEVTEEDCAGLAGEFQGDFSTCASDPCPLFLEPYVDALPIPGVAVPESGEQGGEATYDIFMTEQQQQLHRDLPPTTTWGYNGGYPGPTIEAGVDLPVTVNWINDLRDEFGNLRTEHFLPVDSCMHGAETNEPRTVVHLHGAHVPMEYDGYPEDTFLPGESATYIYENHQLPATLWYHDHALGITRLNVMMGMAGFYLLRDDFEESLNLPDGEFEIPIVIQDRVFNPDGSFQYPAVWEEHFFGDTIVVNGKVWPFLEVKQGKYRFRLVNGSNSRTYALSLSNGAPFNQIGTDGGLLEAPVEMTEIVLSPGERADVVVDFESEAPGTEILILNSAPAPYPGEPGVGVIPEIMKFIVQDQSGDTTPLPATLRPLEFLDEADASEFRDFEMRKFTDPCAGAIWLINGLGWEDITEQPRLGETEVWSFINISGVVHPMHMHLVMFQVLDRQAFEIIDDEIVPIGDPIPPDENEIGWKDTVKANPNEITRVIARFENYTGLYAYHCHILEHEDHEMMRQFEVLPACPGDVNDDDTVDILDLLAVLAAWGQSGVPADVNEDGIVDILDLLAVLAAWGPCA